MTGPPNHSVQTVPRGNSYFQRKKNSAVKIIYFMTCIRHQNCIPFYTLSPIFGWPKVFGHWASYLFLIRPVNSEEYTSIISAQGQSNASKLIGQCFIPQQGNDPKHTLVFSFRCSKQFVSVSLLFGVCLCFFVLISQPDNGFIGHWTPMPIKSLESGLDTERFLIPAPRKQ